MHSTIISEIRGLIQAQSHQAPINGTSPFNIVEVPRVAYAGGVMALSDTACVLAHNGALMPVVAVSCYGKGRVVVAGAPEYLDNQCLGGRYAGIADPLHQWLSMTDGNISAKRIDKTLTHEAIPQVCDYVYQGGTVWVAERGWELLDVLSDYVANQIGDRMPRLGDYPLQHFLNRVGLGLLDAIALWDDNPEKGMPVMSPEASKALGMAALTGWLATNKMGASHLSKRLCTQGEPLFEKGLTEDYNPEALGQLLASAVNASAPNACWINALQSEYGENLNLEVLHSAADEPILRMLQSQAYNDILLNSPQAANALAADYPGRVAKGALPVSRTFTVVGEVPNHGYLQMYSPPGIWQSTGLFADAGQAITLWVFGEEPSLDVQIGCHSDNNASLGKWDRVPVICQRQKLKLGHNTITSPYGGLIYLVPRTSKEQANPWEVRIDGAYPSPRFVVNDDKSQQEQGVFTDAQWQLAIENAVSPWAEIETNRVILTVPTQTAKALKNPNDLAKAWDRMLDSFDHFVGLSTTADYPHKSPTGKYRFVADRQIVAGWMHAGYPIMLFEGITAEDMLTIDGIANVKKGWGFWHELGHNYQQRSWVWEAVVEVTVNIYSLYMQDQSPNVSRLITEKAYQGAFAFMDRTDLQKRYHDDNQIGYFERLVLYRQLETAFGWSLFTALHRAYRERPELFDIQDEQEKIDTFVAVVCQLTNENLLPFFDRWGFCVSEAAITAINGKGYCQQREDYSVWQSPKDTNLVIAQA